MYIYELISKYKIYKKSILIIRLIIVICLIVFCFIIILIICYLLKKRWSTQISSSTDHSIEKQNSLIIHHDVLVKIQHSSDSHFNHSLWNQAPYHTLDFIDEQPIYHTSSNHLWPWENQSNADLIQQKILHRFSTRHRNLNGQPLTQLSVNIPIPKSNSDIKIPVLVKFHQISRSENDSLDEQHNDIEILKICVPLLNQYPSKESIISFDSQNELDEFNEMTLVCMDNE